MSTKDDPAAIMCAPCGQLDAGASGFCGAHKRAFLGPDCDDPKVADLIRELCKQHGVTLSQPPASINVEVGVLDDGARIVKITIPVTGQNLMLNLDPATAINFANCILNAARDAKSPAGLLLPG